MCVCEIIKEQSYTHFFIAVIQFNLIGCFYPPFLSFDPCVCMTRFSHSCCICFYYFLSRWGGWDFLFVWPLFVPPVISSVEQRSSWHIESSATPDLWHPASITEEYSSVQTTNEICGSFIFSGEGLKSGSADSNLWML